MERAEVSNATVARIVLVAAGVVGALYTAYLVRSVLGLLLVSVLFALAIAPAVGFLSKAIPRWSAILAVYLGIGAAIFGIGLLLVPPLVDGIDDLSKDLPGYVEDLRQNETFRDFDDRYGITEQIQDQATELPSKLGDAAGTLRDVTVGVFSSFIQLFSILVVTFFLLSSGKSMLEFGYAQVSPPRSRRLRALADEISGAISGYVFGNFVISIVAGTVTFITLTALDIPFAVPLAILFAFFDLVPLVGATVGGILVGIVVAFVDFPVALIVWVVVLFVYQQIENNMIQPYVYGRAVQLHPLAVIVAILIGAALLGILGALLAIPAAAGLQAIIRDWWEHRETIAMPTDSEAAGGRLSGSVEVATQQPADAQQPGPGV